MRLIAVLLCPLFTGCAALMQAAIQQDAQIRAQRDLERSHWNELNLQLEEAGYGTVVVMATITIAMVASHFIAEAAINARII